MAKAKTSKLESLHRFLAKNTCRYNAEAKAGYKKLGLPAMKELGGLLYFRECEADFNPGGIAVSGDLHLRGMWNDGNGAYIWINPDFGLRFLYREITHMKDYTGGPNNWGNLDLLKDPVVLANTILRFRRAR